MASTMHSTHQSSRLCVPARRPVGLISCRTGSAAGSLAAARSWRDPPTRAQRHSRLVCAAAAQSSAAEAQRAGSELSSKAYQALQGKQVYLVSSQQPVEITSLWGPEERAVFFFGRSMGCPFCWELARELVRDVLPALSSQGIKLFLVNIGTPERGLEFVEKTGFPADRLLADPTNATYDALGFKKGVLATFFSPQTPLAIAGRFLAGGGEQLKEVVGEWTKTQAQGIWHPPKPDQALQQGGVVVFQGRELLWAHYDPATAAHADLKLVARVATEGL